MIYFAANEYGHIKVGVSGDPARRVYNLMHGRSRSKCPPAKTIRLLAVVDGELPTEMFLHQQLSVARIPGFTEWYFPNPAILRLIRAIAPDVSDLPASVLDLQTELILVTPLEYVFSPGFPSALIAVRPATGVISPEWLRMPIFWTL